MPTSVQLISEDQLSIQLIRDTFTVPPLRMPPGHCRSQVPQQFVRLEFALGDFYALILQNCLLGIK